MDLFAAAGIEAPPSGRGAGRPPPRMRSLRQPLFNPRAVDDMIVRDAALFAPGPEQTAAAKSYAGKARSASFRKQKETSVRQVFYQDILQTVLGYRAPGEEAEYSLAFEFPLRSRSVDVALGKFVEKQGAVVAPFELKGPDADLDAVPSGRRESPVQQAWNYAIDAPGAKWVLVSNCVELRLYGFGRGRDAYELFDLSKLDEAAEFKRLWLTLAAPRLLGGATEALLRASDAAYKDITNKLYVQYRALRERVVGFLQHAADGPKLALSPAIEAAQKILDRVLFVAFAERNDLLPPRLLEDAAKERNKFNPHPLWSNFVGLFRQIDKGHYDNQIPPYNGGLFATDPTLDGLEIPDPLAADIAALGQWDYKSDAPVTVLGHIFEQSIEDLEKLRKPAVEEDDAPSRRKREGVVYTPEPITRFLVERTIGLSLEERFDALWAGHGLREGAEDAAREKGFWLAWRDVLAEFTICDPACGSGAFLVAAFDFLAGEYRRIEIKLAALGEALGFDAFDAILARNLRGVDLNAESVEITRLSLWLKTARRDKRLQSLDATIRVGDSLIEDAKFTARPFDWKAAFPDAFARGGFDVVIGNPPYVRMELIKAMKPYLAAHYKVAADRADLYAYFFERGLSLAKPGGRLGFISSSTFFRTGSGENLRAHLAGEAAIETVVDFGDLQIFEGVTTYPAILAMKRGAAEGELRFLTVDEATDDLMEAFDKSSRPMPRARLTAGAWRFEDEPLARLRDKIAHGRKTLGEVYGAPLYGIKTGLNGAFVIDRATRDRLVKADPKSAELLKPFLRGEDIKRWRVESEDLFLINTPKGKVDIDACPAVRDWLLPFRPELEKRATKQEWWELQQAQLAYQPKFAGPKISYPHFQNVRMFAREDTGAFSNDKSYFIPNGDFPLLALLNSHLLWSALTSLAPAVRDGWHEARVQYVEELPIPKMPAAKARRLGALAENSSRQASQQFALQSAVRHRILDLAPPERRKLNTKLEAWHNLDFAAFRAEAKRLFKTDIPVKERADWEKYLAENGAEARRLTAEIEAAERAIDAEVYRLFDLTPDEIALLESSLAGQY